jgi:hypothetical protein
MWAQTAYPAPGLSALDDGTPLTARELSSSRYRRWVDHRRLLAEARAAADPAPLPRAVRRGIRVRSAVSATLTRLS